MIGGAPTDNNALLYHEGQMKVLQPSVSRGDIRIVSDQWARDWLAVEALKIMENALTRSDNKVDAVVAANDGVAGGAIQALAEQKLAGKTLVSGQDAELSACQRIAAGTQSMTVYKPIERLASKAAEVAVKMARRQPHGEATRGIPNGKIDVPSILLAAGGGGQGQPRVHGHRRRIPEARGRLPRRPEGPLAEEVVPSPHNSRTTPAVPRIFSAGYFVRLLCRCPRHRRRRSSSSRRKISRGTTSRTSASGQHRRKRSLSISAR